MDQENTNKLKNNDVNMEIPNETTENQDETEWVNEETDVIAREEIDNDEVKVAVAVEATGKKAEITEKAIIEGKKLSEAEAKYKELLDKYLRLQADQENFKKRIKAESQNLLRYANLPFASALITGLDNLERAIQHIKETGISNGEYDEFIKGVEITFKQFLEAFEKHNITRIKALGEPFDPTKHEAMNVIGSDKVEPNTVVEVYQTGYMLHDRVIKPSMVVVSKKLEK